MSAVRSRKNRSLSLIHIYCEQQSYDLAIIQLKKILSTNMNLLKGHLLLALLYIHADNYGRARNDEAASRPSMRFVQPRTESQQAMRALHRVRESRCV